MNKLVLFLAVAALSLAVPARAQIYVDDGYNAQLIWEIQQQNEIFERMQRQAERAAECQRCINRILAMGSDYQTALMFCSECR